MEKGGAVNFEDFMNGSNCQEHLFSQDESTGCFGGNICMDQPFKWAFSALLFSLFLIFVTISHLAYFVPKWMDRRKMEKEKEGKAPTPRGAILHNPVRISKKSSLIDYRMIK